MSSSDRPPAFRTRTPSSFTLTKAPRFTIGDDFVLIFEPRVSPSGTGTFFPVLYRLSGDALPYPGCSNSSLLGAYEAITSPSSSFPLPPGTRTPLNSAAAVLASASDFNADPSTMTVESSIFANTIPPDAAAFDDSVLPIYPSEPVSPFVGGSAPSAPPLSSDSPSSPSDTIAAIFGAASNMGAPVKSLSPDLINFRMAQARHYNIINIATRLFVECWGTPTILADDSDSPSAIVRTCFEAATAFVDAMPPIPQPSPAVILEATTNGVSLSPDTLG